MSTVEGKATTRTGEFIKVNDSMLATSDDINLKVIDPTEYTYMYVGFIDEDSGQGPTWEVDKQTYLNERDKLKENWDEVKYLIFKIPNDWDDGKFPYSGNSTPPGVTIVETSERPPAVSTLTNGFSSVLGDDNLGAVNITIDSSGSMSPMSLEGSLKEFWQWIYNSYIAPMYYTKQSSERWLTWILTAREPAFRMTDGEKVYFIPMLRDGSPLPPWFDDGDDGYEEEEEEDGEGEGEGDGGDDGTQGEAIPYILKKCGESKTIAVSASSMEGVSSDVVRLADGSCWSVLRRGGDAGLAVGEEVIGTYSSCVECRGSLQLSSCYGEHSMWVNDWNVDLSLVPESDIRTLDGTVVQPANSDICYKVSFSTAGLMGGGGIRVAEVYDTDTPCQDCVPRRIKLEQCNGSDTKVIDKTSSSQSIDNLDQAFGRVLLLDSGDCYEVIGETEDPRDSQVTIVDDFSTCTDCKEGKYFRLTPCPYKEGESPDNYIIESSNLDLTNLNHPDISNKTDVSGGVIKNGSGRCMRIRSIGEKVVESYWEEVSHNYHLKPVEYYNGCSACNGWFQFGECGQSKISFVIDESNIDKPSTQDFRDQGVADIDGTCYWYAGTDREPTRTSNINIKVLFDGGECDECGYHPELECTTLNDDEIYLEWTYSKSTSQFSILRDGIEIATVDGSDYSYTDGDSPEEALEPDTEYCYRVETYSGISSNECCCTTEKEPTPTLTCETQSSNEIKLEWTYADETDEWNVFRGGSKIATLEGSNSYYYDNNNGNGLDPSTEYCYTIETADGISSNECCCTTDSIPVPKNVSCTVESGSEITITWDDVTETDDFDEGGYNVYVSTDGGNTYSLEAELAADVTSYSDTGLDSDTEYCYKISTVDGSEESDKSNSTCCTTTEGAAPCECPSSGLSESYEVSYDYLHPIEECAAYPQENTVDQDTLDDCYWEGSGDVVSLSTTEPCEWHVDTGYTDNHGTKDTGDTPVGSYTDEQECIEGSQAGIVNIEVTESPA